jgi:hypothetical protein
MTLGGMIGVEVVQMGRDGGRWRMELIARYLGRVAVHQLLIRDKGAYTYVDNIPQTVLCASLHICPVEPPDLVSII